ncbi:MAG: M3 family metallopeptidase [Verrucomicrobiales bacterium]|jgi:oligopeptidase A|nr:M3 family metallopeptidase [Verrucomicrobiales bacterium]
MSQAPHPFLADDFHLRWSQLVPSAVETDIRKALEDAQANVDALCDFDESTELTFENTLLALEEATEVLSMAWGRVGHLDSIRNSDDLRAAHNAMLPNVTQFYSRIPLNAALWNRIKSYSATAEAVALPGVRKRFLDETVQDFISSGADLPDAGKQRLEEVQSELARITQKFSENVLDSTNAWDLVLSDASRLVGLPETSLAVLRGEATAKGLGSEEAPAYRITLKAPVYFPVLEYADDATLREEVWRGSITVGNTGDYDNTDLVWEILRLRHERAEILGKKNFADQVLAERMAGSGEVALRFVEDLAERTKGFFAKDIEELETYRRQHQPEWNGAFEPWDLAYWSEKLRKANYDFDEEELRPYFSIENVIEGMFRLTEQIFGFKIVEGKSIFVPLGETTEHIGVEVWHPEVKFYELHDAKSGEHLGSFYADWHPREEKRGGAWMNYLRTGSPVIGNQAREPHLGLICGNLTPSSQNKPALLTHREVETVFHEFGHLLHHLLGEVEIKSLNGVKVVWDFVELPSQIMENFCWSRVSLDFFAKHYVTGNPIPEALFQKMLGARNFQSATAQMRQLAFGKMDLDLHIRHYARPADKSLDEVVQEILEGYTMPLATRPPTMARRFTHLFASATGYAAGYYSYKWAEVLDADAFTRFASDGVISPVVGREFREKILSRGNSVEAAILFRDFMGRDPELNALLERSGLVAG